MKNEKILDNFLIELSEYNQKNKLSSRPEYLLKQNKEISDQDKYLILQKFVKDGYANESTKEEYWITFLGKMFIDNGGYVKQKQKETITKNFQLMQTWAIAIGTALAGLWALYLFLKEIFRFCVLCGC